MGVRVKVGFKDSVGVQIGQNSIAFGKSTSQRIYPEHHTPKIGWKLHKYGLKTCFTYMVILGDHNIKKTSFENFDF